MDGLVILIMIAGFIRTIINAGKADKQNEKKHVVPNQRSRPDKAAQWGTQSQKDADVYAQQQSTKERLQKKYGLQRPVETADILARARENVQENEADELQQEVHAQVCRAYRENSQNVSDVELHKAQSVNCDTIEESDIMKKVNDLMVTGYSGEMNFERDFVAEGIEMLNRFSF